MSLSYLNSELVFLLLFTVRFTEVQFRFLIFNYFASFPSVPGVARGAAASRAEPRPVPARASPPAGAAPGTESCPCLLPARRRPAEVTSARAQRGARRPWAGRSAVSGAWERRGPGPGGGDLGAPRHSSRSAPR